ncbi:hypothetical protein IGI37_003803 [Enterococcus sp. AZ194]|uniref:LytTR family DNA-binding domain-containing protein n=1 Tax=Enterococcus sp. AZ194 TaxID=2774629 RepID=UPI003F214478
MDIKIHINKTLANIRVLIEAPSNELAQGIYTQLAGNKQNDTLTIKTNEGLELIKMNEIELIEVFSDELVISTIMGKDITFRGRLYKIKGMLDEQQFVQITKSTVVNLKQVQKLENSFSGNMLAILKSGERHSISRRYLPELKKILRQMN